MWINECFSIIWFEFFVLNEYIVISFNTSIACSVQIAYYFVMADEAVDCFCGRHWRYKNPILCFLFSDQTYYFSWCISIQSKIYKLLMTFQWRHITMTCINISICSHWQDRARGPVSLFTTLLDREQGYDVVLFTRSWRVSLRYKTPSLIRPLLAFC